MVTFAQDLKSRFPMTVADYMAACNRHYYNTRDPLGAQGDFTTAPEISQIFGEVIGAFIGHIWHVQGARTPLHLIEGGPGRGTLMADILRVLSKIEGCTETAEVTFLENSETLRGAQAAKLAGYQDRLKWASDISEISLENKSKIFIFNEFLDALPSEQFIKAADGWRQRLVTESGFAAGDLVNLDVSYTANENDILELSPDRTAFMKVLCRHVQGGGMAIIIDYGTGNWAVGDSLQALYKHKPCNPLDYMGEADLTTHVDFGALADVARGAGLYVHPLMTQRAFLDRLGGAVRATRLGKQADYDRLTAPDQMGILFKVLVVAHPDWAPSLQEVLP